ncbi:hypothetical protein EDD85DRAFT_977525 [Armillaria nabsnona]|nr:hypothetical protein EDD85DRAFT_977525 [Armillaria nabsnona]
MVENAETYSGRKTQRSEAGNLRKDVTAASSLAARKRLTNNYDVLWILQNVRTVISEVIAALESSLSVDEVHSDTGEMNFVTRNVDQDVKAVTAEPHHPRVFYRHAKELQELQVYEPLWLQGVTVHVYDGLVVDGDPVIRIRRRRVIHVTMDMMVFPLPETTIQRHTNQYEASSTRAHQFTRFNRDSRTSTSLPGEETNASPDARQKEEPQFILTANPRPIDRSEKGKVIWESVLRKNLHRMPISVLKRFFSPISGGYEQRASMYRTIDLGTLFET